MYCCDVWPQEIAASRRIKRVVELVIVNDNKLVSSDKIMIFMTYNINRYLLYIVGNFSNM